MRHGHRRSKRSTDETEPSVKPKSKRRKHNKRRKGNDFESKHANSMKITTPPSLIHSFFTVYNGNIAICPGDQYTATNITSNGGLLAFNELEENTDDKKNTEALVDIAEALLEEHISRDEKRKPHHQAGVREEDKQAAVMDELVKVIRNLEAKVNSLQTKVQHLHGRLENTDLPK